MARIKKDFNSTQETQKALGLKLLKHLSEAQSKGRKPDTHKCLKWIDQGADLDVKEEDLWDAAFYAVLTQSKNILEKILGLRPDLARRTAKETLLDKAIEYESDEIGAFLTQNGVPCKTRTLTEAISKRLEKTALALIDQGMHLAHIDHNGTTPLHEAARQNMPAVANALCKRLANTSATDNYGTTPLGHAVASSDNNAVLLDCLLEHGADPNVAKLDSEHPLFDLLEEPRDIPRIKVLLDYHSDIETRENGNTVLMRACEISQPETIQYLISRGANVNAVNDYKETPLFLLIDDNAEVADAMVAAGANIEHKSRHGETPLIKAVRDNRFDYAEKLLSMGANAAATSSFNGRTALSYAAELGDIKMVQTLIAAGCPASLADKAGKTARDYAKNKKIQDFLAGRESLAVLSRPQHASSVAKIKFKSG